MYLIVCDIDWTINIIQWCIQGLVYQLLPVSVMRPVNRPMVCSCNATTPLCVGDPVFIVIIYISVIVLWDICCSLFRLLDVVLLARLCLCVVLWCLFWWFVRLPWSRLGQLLSTNRLLYLISNWTCLLYSSWLIVLAIIFSSVYLYALWSKKSPARSILCYLMVL